MLRMTRCRPACAAAASAARWTRSQPASAMRERVVDRQIVNRPRLRVAVRIGGEVAGHVLDQLARVGAHRGREQHGGQVRPAAAERRDRAAGADAEEAGDDDDARRGRARPAGAAAARVVRRVDRGSGDEAGLVDVEGNGVTPMRCRCSASSATDRSSPVDHSRSSASSDAGSPAIASRFGEQRVGRAVLRRDDDDEPLVGMSGVSRSLQEPRRRGVRRVVAQHRAADLEDAQHAVTMALRATAGKAAAVAPVAACTRVERALHARVLAEQVRT